MTGLETMKGAKRRVFEILTGQREIATTHGEARRLLAQLEGDIVRDAYGQRTTLERHVAPRPHVAVAYLKQLVRNWTQETRPDGELVPFSLLRDAQANKIGMASSVVQLWQDIAAVELLRALKRVHDAILVGDAHTATVCEDRQGGWIVRRSDGAELTTAGRGPHGWSVFASQSYGTKEEAWAALDAVAHVERSNEDDDEWRA